MWGFIELHQATLWNPADKDSSITISGGGLTIGGGASGFVSARTKQRLAPNQKLYFEWTVVQTGDNFGIGVANANASLSTYIGGDQYGVSYYAGGLYSYNGGQTTSLPAAAVNDVWGFASDGVNGKVWVRQNGGNWNNDVITNQNPATNTGGLSCSTVFASPIMIGYTSNNSSTELITINCGSAAFNATPPAGFRAVNSLATK